MYKNIIFDFGGVVVNFNPRDFLMDHFMNRRAEEETYDIVVANILSNPLKLLAPALLGRVGPAGSLVLSGVLARQAEEVIEVYRQADPSVELSVWQEESGWVCIAGSRKS